MGKIYISQLFSQENIKNILDTYDIGLEVVEFGVGYNLDKNDNGIKEYCDDMGSLIKDRPLSIHGPFLDLNTASFDKLIKQVTLTRYNQAYDVAKKLGADRIVFHSCYYEDIYFKEAYINNSLEFWKEFLSDKDESVKIHIENMYDKDISVLKELVDKVNNDIFSICLDIGHANCYSNQSLHLNNNYGKKDSHNGFENGNINVKQVLKLVDGYCDKPSMTIEVTDFNEAIESVEFILEYNNSRY